MSGRRKPEHASYGRSSCSAANCYEICCLLVEGLEPQEIASRLHLHLRTVQVGIKRLGNEFGITETSPPYLILKVAVKLSQYPIFRGE